MNLLVDASNVCWRAYWGGKQFSKAQTQGDYTDVHVFLNSLRSYKNMYPNSDMWLVWDKKLARHLGNPRKELLEDYKGSRDTSKAQEVFKNTELIEKITSYLGVRNFYPYRLEADDCISWLCQKGESIIFSADEDMAQLVRPSVSVYNLNKKKLFTHENFEESYGMTPQQFILYKCIMGDSSDDIQGIPGYGKVRSKRLAIKWEESNVDESIRTLVENNRKLVDLLDNVFLDEDELKCYEEQYNLFADVGTDFTAFEDCLKELELRTQSKHIREWQRLFDTPATSGLRDVLASLDILK